MALKDMNDALFPKKKCKLKIIMIYHFSPIRLASVKKPRHGGNSILVYNVRGHLKCCSLRGGQFGNNESLSRCALCSSNSACKNLSYRYTYTSTQRYM